MADDQNPNASTGLAEKKIVGETSEIRMFVAPDPLVKMLGVFSSL